MELPQSTINKIIFPRIPLILKTSALHAIGQSPGAKVWDFRTELLVTVLRSLLTDGTQAVPLEKAQRASIRDNGVPGNLWVSRTKCEAPPEDDMRQLLFSTIDMLKEGGETYTAPDAVAVEAEWHGYRKTSVPKSPKPKLTDAEEYQLLLKEVQSDVTILYIHGGAMYLCDPCTHRAPASLPLLKRTKGRVYSVRYRLAPQTPFPGPLLDCLQSYLALLSPPPGAPHSAVHPSKIVICGDSAGGNLSLALLQLLLRNEGRTVKFHGKDIKIALPAGVALSSPWGDVSHSMPSITTNAKFDYFPRLWDVRFSADRIWPANPPRGEIYCNANAICHPLVSPLTTKNWSGSPPVYIMFGQEVLEDECRIMASKFAKQGVVTVGDGYEGMPHCFQMFLPGQAVGALALDNWATFIKTCVDNPGSLVTKGSWTRAKTLQREEVKVEELGRLSGDEAKQLMRAKMQRKLEVESRLPRVFPAKL